MHLILWLQRFTFSFLLSTLFRPCCYLFVDFPNRQECVESGPTELWGVQLTTICVRKFSAHTQAMHNRTWSLYELWRVHACFDKMPSPGRTCRDHIKRSFHRNLFRKSFYVREIERIYALMHFSLPNRLIAYSIRSIRIPNNSVFLNNPKSYNSRWMLVRPVDTAVAYTRKSVAHSNATWM